MEWRLSTTLVPLSTLAKHVLCPTILIRTTVVLSYKILGDSGGEPDEPPLILLHGLLGSKKHWESLGKTLFSMTKRLVVVVDQRNHGASPHTNSHRYDQMAKDLLRLLEKLKVDRACLIGHSMGGRTGMCTALIAPEKVAGLLVVDVSPITSPPILTDHYPKVLAAMKAVDFKKKPKHVRKARKEAKKQLKAVIKDDQIMSVVLSNINVKSGRISWRCNLDALIKNFEYIVSFPPAMKGKKYRGPTLFLGGQLSDFIPPDDLTKIRGLFPNAVVHYIPSTGHNPQVDAPKTFLEYCIAFIKTILQ